jgi:hypothetical protein
MQAMSAHGVRNSFGNDLPHLVARADSHSRRAHQVQEASREILQHG